MNQVIKGYKKLRTVAPGNLVRFRDGEYALVSEYHTTGKGYLDTYLYGTGEICHVNGDEWVAIIDLDMVETEAIEEAEYPPASNAEGLE